MHHVEYAALFRQPADLQHVLDKYGGFHVSGGNGAAAVLRGFLDHLFGRQFIVQGIFGNGLRDFPVLTEFAVQIASRGCNGERPSRGEQVEKGLLFDRIDVNCTWVPIDEGIVFTVAVFSNPAIPALTVCNFALPWAEFAPDALFGKSSVVGREFAAY